MMAYKDANLPEYSCRICGLRQEIRPIENTKNGYLIIRCSKCSFESVYPLPTDQELSQWYQNYHFTKTSADEWENLKRLSRLHQPIVNFLVSKLNDKSSPRFLDYGFGKGAFLIQVAKNCLAAIGIEINDESCRQLREYSQYEGLDIKILKISSSFPEDLLNEHFDCITLFSVIEHVLNPIELVSRLYGLQKKEGILYIECPNNDAFYLKAKNLLRKKIDREGCFNSLNPPQHLNGFNRYAMTELLQRAGYSVIEVKDYRVSDNMHQVENISWYPSLLDIMLNKNCRNPYAISQCLHKILDFLVHYIFGAGTGLYALARKT